MTVYVDHEALDGITKVLANAGSELDGVSSSAPGAVDGGDGTPAILGIMARLADNAGQLVVALSAASSAVDQASESYRGQDDETADNLNSTVWTT